MANLYTLSGRRDTPLPVRAVACPGDGRDPPRPLTLDQDAGEPGEKRVIQDRLGQTIEDIERIRAPRPGQDLVSSIDLRVQYLAYRELKAAVRDPEGTMLDLWVVDNGRGGAHFAPGHGLAGLRERVWGLRGTFDVESPVGGPTTIGVHVPLVSAS